MTLWSPFRERSRDLLPMASQTRQEGLPTTRPPPPPARFPGLGRLFFHRFLLLLLIALPPVAFFLLLRCRRHSPLSFPLEVSRGGLQPGPLSGPAPERISVRSVGQLRRQPDGGARRRRAAAVHQPRHFQSREGQAETQRCQTFCREEHQRRRRWAWQGPSGHTPAPRIVR